MGTGCSNVVGLSIQAILCLIIKLYKLLNFNRGEFLFSPPFMKLSGDEPVKNLSSSVKPDCFFSSVTGSVKQVSVNDIIVTTAKLIFLIAFLAVGFTVYLWCKTRSQFACCSCSARDKSFFLFYGFLVSIKICEFSVCCSPGALPNLLVFVFFPPTVSRSKYSYFISTYVKTWWVTFYVICFPHN